MSPLDGRAFKAVLQKPNWPGALERPPEKARLGIDYDSSWARTPPARAVRYVITETITRPFTRVVTSFEVHGDRQLAEMPAPVIFAANHASHLDTAVVISALPAVFRRKTVVAAAADTFFDRAWKADMWTLLLATFPIERQRINRQSHDIAADLIAKGWSLLIYPEGGRTHDGWGQEFNPASAAYLAKRAGVPVIPIHLRGVRPVFPRGSGKLRPGKVEVRIGAALRPEQRGGKEEPTRQFSARIEQAVALMADEAETNWWSARQRAAKGSTPALGGPATSGWRRTWELPESARRSPTSKERRSAKPW